MGGGIEGLYSPQTCYRSAILLTSRPETVTLVEIRVVATFYDERLTRGQLPHHQQLELCPQSRQRPSAAPSRAWHGLVVVCCALPVSWSMQEPPRGAKSVPRA